MILKKPYAFLIKKFRLIHLVLSFLIGFILYRSVLIVKFFIEYIKNNYKSSVLIGLENVYTSSIFFIAILLVLALAISIYYLLKHKNKPTKLYLFMIIYYVFLLICLIYIREVLSGLSEELLSAKLSRSIRDFSIVITAVQLIFLVFSIIRAIGFDIKKFNFKSDLREMNYDFSDSEEVEVNINLNSYKYKRKIRRSLREFTYYLKENKLFVTISLGILAFILIILFIKNRNINYNQSYKTGKVFTYNNMQLTVDDSIVTNLDYKGNIIKNGYYYVVLKVNLKNNSGLTRKIDFNQFNLSVGGTLVKPILSMSSYFIDYASENVISEFSHKTDKTFALVYEINEKNRNSGFKLDIYNGTVRNKKDYTTKHIYVSIRPKKISDLKLNGNYALGQKVTFDDTYLGNTILKVQSYELNKTYFYTYEKCFKDNCNAYDDAITVPFTASRHNNYILTLHINYTPDGDMLYSKSNTLPRRFANDFMTIQYKVDDKVYSNNSINVTPDYQKDFIAFEVGGEIVDASVIQAIITIRNQKYIINLKS